MTNNEIAAELYLSAKTVSRHLSNIFTKIGVIVPRRRHRLRLRARPRRPPPLDPSQPTFTSACAPGPISMGSELAALEEVDGVLHADHAEVAAAPAMLSWTA